MNCRICFEGGTAGTLLTPCRCIGTSQYIHKECLERYIHYYPDRICRVCLEEMNPPPPHQDHFLASLMLIGLGATLSGSGMSFTAKAMLGMVLVALAGYFVKRNLFNRTAVVGVLIFYMAFVGGGTSYAGMIMLFTIVLVATAVTLLLYIPAIHVMSMLVTLLVFSYVLVTSVAFAGIADSYGMTVYMCLIFMGWYAWICEHPPTLFRG